MAGLNILLTGRPGIGKTTVIQRVIQRQGGSASGFYTQEIREGGVRQGFEALTLDGRRALLAHVESSSPLRVSKYGVELEEFERSIVPSIDPRVSPAEVIVVDEIGKMECFSAAFCQEVVKALDSETIVLGTIAERGSDFIESLKERQDIVLVEVTQENREALPARIVEMIRSRGFCREIG